MMDFIWLADSSTAIAQAELSARELCGMILAGVGLLFFLGAAVGLYRFPDFYTRMHAAGKGDTLSSLLILAGFALIMLTSPTSTHALMRAGFEDGVEPVTKKPKKRGGSKKK
jgi:multicomponent Na+:H+ antiporter subunit G